MLFKKMLTLASLSLALASTVNAQSSFPSQQPINEAHQNAFNKKEVPGKLTVHIKIAYDAQGTITNAALEKSTGSPNLDKAILAWAKGVKMDPGHPGEGMLPFTLKLN